MSQEHPDTPKRNDLTEAVRSSALPQRDGTQVSQEAHASWEIARLVDERTGDSCLGFDFPTRLQGRAFEVVDDDLTEKPDRIRALLKKRGAAFEGSTEDQIKFVKKLIKTLSPEPQILAMKPGFRDDGFILGKRMLGSARGKYRWKPAAQNLGAADIGDAHGDRDAWARDVGEVALKSSALSCALMIGLASCIPSYFEWRMKRSKNLPPLLSETATFNFEGESAAGKTIIARAAAGLIGPPQLIGRWDFSRRGLEELAEARNNLPNILDDIETHVEDTVRLKTALRYVTQVIPKGTSKHIARVAQKSDLPPLSWSNFGLTTSPPNFDKIAKGLGWSRSNGECARFISIPVPGVSKGGILDRLKGTTAMRVAQAKVLTHRLELGISQNYGLIYSPWVEFLLRKDRSPQIVNLVDRFVRTVTPDGDGWDARYARKFGVLYAVGRLAVAAKIMPWPKSWPMRAVTRCYRRAIAAIRSDQASAVKTIKLIAGLSSDQNRFERVPSRARHTIRVHSQTHGLRTTYRGKSVLAVRDEALRNLCGSKKVAKSVIEELQRQRLLVGGHGHARTTQLPVAIEVNGCMLKKPRFWLIKRRALQRAVRNMTP